MAALTVVSLPIDGGVSLTDSLVAAAGGGDTAPCGPGRFLVVANGDASPHTATVATPGNVSGLDVEDCALVVPAGKTGIMPLARAIFAGANGRATVTYNGVTSVKVGVFEVPQ
ncbi:MULTISPECIES: hypothetical protein [unclassified Streptomyces]|uniref:hypothetical protein n=1 Tax=unclassified Streptomyces TaxID=2593676 RepID=UPI00226F82F3|nr:MULTISPECIES: hypothetical protein [unclassified Streptomyces]MCY0919607.1 hypothetical protein [Streptomyces sp. H27-G5]MCY0957211.1 hypothetical protein [Streptomyces sp. H27-H5]